MTGESRLEKTYHSSYFMPFWAVIQQPTKHLHLDVPDSSSPIGRNLNSSSPCSFSLHQPRFILLQWSRAIKWYNEPPSHPNQALGISFNSISPQPFFLSFFFLIFLFIIYLLFLFLAVLGLRFCARALSSCGEWGPLFIAVRGPLTIAASLVAEQRLQTRRLSSCGSRAQLLHGMWDLPRPGLKPVSPALAGRFSTTAPPGKPPYFLLVIKS